MRHLFHVFMIAAIIWAALSWMKQPSIHTAPGVLVPEEPVQGECERQVVAQVKDYTITGMASYLIHARVLHTKHYWADGNDLVPYDVGLGWGPMSDQSVLDQLEISQGNRFLFYHWRIAPPIPVSEIECHASNNHLIAANSSVAHVISQLYPGEIVTMQGYLVNVTGPNGFHWDTSLTRTDTGNGACEVMYVMGVKVDVPPGG